MKIALYIEDGLEQLVLTPESDHESNLLSKLDAKDRTMKIKRGDFYKCHGGWYRYEPSYMNQYVHGQRMADKSTIIVLERMEAANGAA